MSALRPVVATGYKPDPPESAFVTEYDRFGGAITGTIHYGGDVAAVTEVEAAEVSDRPKAGG